MSASLLKWLALITMAFDHMGAIFFPTEAWIRIAGRISFPIFAFLLVQGFIHTHSRFQYGLRLGLFAVIAEIPYDFVLYGRLVDWQHQSIMAQLLLGFLALCFLERAQKRRKPLYLLGVLLCAAASLFAHASYSLYGVSLILAFYLLRKFRGADMLALLALTWLFYGAGSYGFSLWGQSYTVLSRNTLQLYAVFASVPLVFYSGKKGVRCPKWFFYFFYPAHLLLFWAVKEQIWTRLPFMAVH